MVSSLRCGGQGVTPTAASIRQPAETSEQLSRWGQPLRSGMHEAEEVGLMRLAKQKKASLSTNTQLHVGGAACTLCMLHRAARQGVYLPRSDDGRDLQERT